MTTHPRQSHHRGPRRGFSLIELLIAMSLAALIVTALAATTQVFSSQVAYIQDETDVSAEDTLAMIGEAVRRSWAAAKPSDAELALTDAYGNQTSFRLDGSDLRVTRPSGVTGVVLEGLASVTWDVETLQRLRDSPPIDMGGTVWSRAAAGTTPPILLPSDPYEDDDGDPKTLPHIDIKVTTPGFIHDRQELALGFTLSADAPDAVDTVENVGEQLVIAALDSLMIPLAFVDGLPPSAVADDDGDIDDDVEVAICHIPGGDASARHLMYVSQHEVSKHLKHGDTIGTCMFPPGELVVELYEARAPTDAEPYGPLLGSLSLSTAALPPAEFTWVPFDLDVDNDIDIDDELVPAVVTPSVDVPIDLSPLSMLVRPGQAHTLVLRYEGGGTIAHNRILTGGAQTDVALKWPDTPSLLGWPVKATASDGFVPQKMDVRHSFGGLQTFTQTEAQEAVSKVTVTFTMDDGRTLTGSSVVASQAAVSHPWRGSVASQAPSLEMAGR